MKTADEIRSSSWTKNWEGKFSLLFSLIGLKLANFKSLLGCGPTKALLFYKDGVSSCYFANEEMTTFGTDLLAIIQKKPQALDSWIAQTRNDIDAVKDLAKSEKIVASDLAKITQLFQSFGVYMFALKELGNYLPEHLQTAILPKLTEIRKYGETLYFDTSECISRVLGLIEKETAVPLRLLECLTPEECIQYLELKTPPDVKLLARRNLSTAIFFNSEPKVLDAIDLKLVQEYIFKKIEDVTLKGQTGYPGVVTGKVRIITKFTKDITLEKGDILVTGMTDPRFIALMEKAGAIITDAGGILCHAAIVAREMQKPCIIGTKFATRALKDNDLVEVDAERGVVNILKKYD